MIFSGTGIRGFGKLIVIKHNNAFLSVYGHNNELLVKEGQNVGKGQKIAEMGNTDSRPGQAALRDPPLRQAGGSAEAAAAAAGLTPVTRVSRLTPQTRAPAA